MKVYMLWNGGHNYAAPRVEEAEHCASLKAAVQLFEDRLHNRVFPATPRVDDTAEAWLCVAKPEYDVYPDYIIDIGPRGGIRLHRHV